MAETLTESFCESCGTRYEFSAPTRLNTLGKTRGLFGGIRNYFTGNEALGEAIGDSMRSQEESLAAAQLDAFHSTFSFCISCRQYTCTKCWNTDAGRCINCSPLAAGLTRLGTGGVAAIPPANLGAARPAAEPPLTAGTWPMIDLPAESAPAFGSEPVDWPSDDLAEAAASPAEGAWAPSPATADVEMPQLVEEPAEEPTFAEAQPAAEAGPVPDELEEPIGTWLVEPVEIAQHAADDVEVEPQPVEAEIAPQPVEAAVEFEVEPQPVAGEAEVEPEPAADVEYPEIARVSESVVRFPYSEQAPTPAAAEPVQPSAPEPVAPPDLTQPQPILHPPPAPSEPEALERVAAVADDADLAARRAKLDLLGLGDPGEGPVLSERQVLPYRSRGAAVHQTELAQRAALAGTLWAASAREVAGAASHIGIQACGECGLSLSASARFCRRCGTRQARSA